MICAPGTSQNTGRKFPTKQLNRLWSTTSSEVSEDGAKMELQIMGEEDKSRYCYFLGLWLVSLLLKIIFILRSLKFTLSAQNVSESGQRGLKTRNFSKSLSSKIHTCP